MVVFEKDLDLITKSRVDFIEELKKEKIKLESRKKKVKDTDIKGAIDLAIKKIDYSINDVLNEIKFCRVPTQEDINYRINQITNKEFLKEMFNSFPEDLPLRFHGSPIYRTKQIIEDGVISSSVDRIGFTTSSNNLSNQISTYDKSAFGESIINYTNLTDIYIPLGCLFVLIDPNNPNVLNNGLCTMPNINLKENPDLLFAIITSPESSVIVKEWCNQHDIDSNKVFDYNGFIEYNKQRKNNMVTIK